jgi:hypothetical protein
MKVFLSWSGDLSHEVACTLRDWLPCVIQSLKPWVSSEDIEKGTRWSTDIAKELRDTAYGILCVTKENLGAPWVHALIAEIGRDDLSWNPAELFRHPAPPNSLHGPLSCAMVTHTNCRPP